MITNRHFTLLCILGLILSFVSAGCVSTTTEDVESSVEPPPTEKFQEDYPGGMYEQGDDLYPGGYYIHTVSLPDESISIIAKWYTGDLKKWQMLADCNPAINPNRIFLGNKIKIPRSVMVRQDPMTPQFVLESQPTPKKKKISRPAVSKTKPTEPETPPPAEPEPAVDEEPLLFGPKGYSKD